MVQQALNALETTTGCGEKFGGHYARVGIKPAVVVCHADEAALRGANGMAGRGAFDHDHFPRTSPRQQQQAIARQQCTTENGHGSSKDRASSNTVRSKRTTGAAG
jgi:hypothetical protein